MKASRSQRIYASNLIALLIFLLLLTLPVSAHAIPYIYTYTGNPFTDRDLFKFQPPGNFITAEFTYDGPLAIGPAAPPPDLVLACGPYSVTAADPDLHSSLFHISEVDAQGLPLRWYIDLTTYGRTDVDISLLTESGPNGYPTPSPHISDWAYLTEWNGDAGTSFIASNTSDPGTWTRRSADYPAVPEPATLFLLGTGLIGLVGVSRKKTKQGKHGMRQ